MTRADSVVGSDAGAECGIDGVAKFGEICVQLGALLGGDEQTVLEESAIPSVVGALNVGAELRPHPQARGGDIAAAAHRPHSGYWRNVEAAGSDA